LTTDFQKPGIGYSPLLRTTNFVAFFQAFPLMVEYSKIDIMIVEKEQN
jgi:hypothetical protein